jgi:uncharacterized protein YuzE
MNASERPDLIQERVVYAESTAQVYVYDHVNNWWEAWARVDDDRDGVGYDTEELPDDAGPLYSPDRWPHPEKVRADAAEAKIYAAQVRNEKLSDLIDRVRQVILDFGQLDIKMAPIDAIEKIDELVNGDEELPPHPATPSVSSPEGGPETPTEDADIYTVRWVVTGESILDDPEEYRHELFVHHDSLMEIIAAWNAANGLRQPTGQNVAVCKDCSYVIDREPVGGDPASPADLPVAPNLGAGDSEVPELATLPPEVRRLVHAVDRMRDSWNNPDGKWTNDELWRHLHLCNDAVWGRGEYAGSVGGDSPTPSVRQVAPTLGVGKLEVDDEASAWYIRLSDEQVAQTTEQPGPIHIDWSRDGRMVGVEILSRLDRPVGGGDSTAPETPRVYLPGEKIPAGVRVMVDHAGEVMVRTADFEWSLPRVPSVEVMGNNEFLARVKAARIARPDSENTYSGPDGFLRRDVRAGSVVPADSPEDEGDK